MNFRHLLHGCLWAVYLLLTSQVHAQHPERKYTDNAVGWFAYVGDHRFTPTSRWGVHLEGQLRRQHIVTDPQQIFVRWGVNYYLSDAAFLVVGHAYAKSYPYGEFGPKCVFPEHRIWEQLQFKQHVGPFDLISRLRLEQRFASLPVPEGDHYVPGDAVYSNRMRYMQRLVLPLGKAKAPWFLAASDELFVSWGKHVGHNIFDQNRAYLGLGYKIPRVGGLEVGYVNHLLFKSDGVRVEQNHILQVMLLSSISLSK